MKTVFNISQNEKGDILQRVKTRRSRFIRINCEPHNFMFSWGFSADNPYAVVVNSDGTYLSGWPQFRGGYRYTSWLMPPPSVGDINNDGEKEIVSGASKYEDGTDWGLGRLDTCGYAWDHAGNLLEGWPVDCSESKCLLVSSPDNAPDSWTKIDTIDFLDNTPAFEIYDNKTQN